MSAESPRHARSGGPLTVPSQPPKDRSLIDAVSGFINDVTLSSSSSLDPKDVIQWARFETADINEPTPEGDADADTPPLLLVLGYGAGVQVWLIPPAGEAQEVLSWRQGTVRVLRVLPTPQQADCFASKRPLIALCDSASPGPSFCSLSFISIRGGEQVKSIKFKNPILDVLANKRSVVVSFSERFAVFDAGTLEDRLAVTTCYPCPCPLGGSAPINPLTLGDRWLAYADKKLNPSKRSSGGCEGEGVASYTATVLYAAKSLSKGLRGLSESVAAGLAGARGTSQSPSPPNADAPQPGVITILDIEGNDEDEGRENEESYDPTVAHFIAHSEAIIALKFDASGMLLVTADRRGHDFHVFRINPHPCGPSLASVHHLYVLHRGDTTAKVQDIAISADSRWTAVSTLRGTTHVFATSTYGGACGVRTHTAPRVVNRLSRFHRSAGLAAGPHKGAGPVSEGAAAGGWFPNPRLPPYPQPVLAAPLAQLRTTHLPTHTITRTSSGRQRLSSLSEDGGFPPLLSRAHFGPAAPGAAAGRHTALYLMAAHGTLTQLLLRPAPLAAVPKEKICDESPIELQVEPVAQWGLQRPPAATDLLAPLPPSNPLLQPLSCRRCADMCLSEEERWLSQVEIVTHAGPHRRLWMGPQFVFKMYCTGSNSSLSEAETVEVDTSAARGVARSNPVNMPVVPVLIDSGSASSLEHSPSDSYRRKSLLAESGRAASVCDVQLKEDLAEAMKEDHGWLGAEAAPAPRASGVARAVDPQGTVVAPGPRVEPPQPDDCAAPNADEATFRPVLRAPAPPAPPDLPVRPLPRGTTLPVQPAPPLASPPAPPALALTTDVVIPAALGPAYSDFEFDSPLRKSDLEAAADDESYLDSTVTSNLERMTTRASDDVDVVRERSSVSAERERKVDVESLPKLYSAPDDIQPAARVRVKKSPTPKSVSDTEVSDVIRVKDVKCREIDKPEKVKGSETKKVTVKELETKEVTFSEPAPVEVSEPKDVVDLEPKTCDLTVSQQKQKNVSELKEIKVSEPKKLETLDSQDIIVSEPNEKKVLISKEASDSESKEVNLEQRKVKSSEHKEVNVAEIKEVKFSDKKEMKAAEPRSQEIRDVKGSRDKTSKQSNKLSKEKKDAKIVEDTKQKYSQTKIEETWDGKGYKDKSQKNNKSLKEKKDITVESGNEKYDTRVTTEVVASPTVVTPMVKLSSKKETSPNRVEKLHQDEIKTEDQAWDMLLNEPDKLVSNVTSALQMPVVTEKTCDASKGKVKKNRKSKKAFDESTTKTDDDSFVEIHTIDDKQQSSGGNLVAISTFEESIDFCSMAKTKKVRGTKSVTPERNYDYGKSDDIWGLKRDDSKIQTSLNITHNEDFSNTAFCDPLVLGKSKESYKEKDVPKAKTHKEGTLSETTSFIAKEIPKQHKSKSLSPYLQGRKYSNADKKDVYIIDTAEEDFPEIQITHSNKARKRSPKPVEATSQEEEIVIEKPVKSWSFIAASKSSNKTKDVSRKVEMQEIEMDFPSTSKYTEKEEHDEKQAVLKGISLHEKLFELCKRTDIMVAECDTPTELSFVDEHVLTPRDLPPLEPLDFGLEEFKLDIMKDSLLDIKNTKVTSPICKINIDDILSSIKETTSKVIESSSFNLIDVEKVPAKIEKDFNVIESDKITSQEVILEADGKLGSELVEIMEKSSDEENTPIGSTDSDKEDKKNIGASNVLPSIKQSAKPKKSRRKKK